MGIHLHAEFMQAPGASRDKHAGFQRLQGTNHVASMGKLSFACLCQWQRGVLARAVIGRRPEASPGGALMQRLGDLVHTLISRSPPVTYWTSWRPFESTSHLRTQGERHND